MRRASTRRGTIYFMVLATVVVVVTLALTGLTLVRVQRRQQQVVADVQDARMAAMSAVNFATAKLSQSNTWRSTAAAAGGELFNTPYGRGTIGAIVTDPVDGDLTDSDDEPVELQSSGGAGEASQSYTVLMMPQHQPMSCLGVGVSAKLDSKVDRGVVTGTGKVTVNAKFDAVSARVYLPVEATETISGSTYYSTQTPLQPARQIPTVTALAWYVANGTQIATGSIPGERMENIVLSPGNNPYGSRATDPRGIYWLDGAGKNYVISNVRVVGTLVLVNVNDVVFAGGINWEPADAALPALLIDGKPKFDTTMAPLSEATVGVNFNPASTPYRGASNVTTTDSFPSMIKGLVFSTDTMEVREELTIEGLLVCGNQFKVTGILGLVYDNRYYYSPPPGFRASTTMVAVPGTFYQIVN
jgi:hypothetical protein